ncbi:hypothetical protein HanRHA438_Chr12g0559701 [Helianthus annuus]|nr:hypothetical protein HanRHA438_Chr12g0559701 [Helianthus annuus]
MLLKVSFVLLLLETLALEVVRFFLPCPTHIPVLNTLPNIHRRLRLATIIGKSTLFPALVD